jgi:hypothetical protein
MDRHLSRAKPADSGLKQRIRNTNATTGLSRLMVGRWLMGLVPNTTPNSVNISDV